MAVTLTRRASSGLTSSLDSTGVGCQSRKRLASSRKMFAARLRASVVSSGLAGLIVGCAVGDRLAERVRRALACRETPASCADEVALWCGPVAPDPRAEICGDPSAGETPAEQAEATRDACAPAEEARS